MSNFEFNMLTKTLHHHSLEDTSYDLEDSQFATMVTFRHILSLLEIVPNIKIQVTRHGFKNMYMFFLLIYAWHNTCEITSHFQPE